MGRVDAAMRRAAGVATEGQAEQSAAIGVIAPDPVVEEAAPGRVETFVTFDQIDGSLSRKVIVDKQMSSASREQYRRLAASLHQAQVAAGLRVIMIASAVPGEGKTLTASNLSLTLSESYRQAVLLIDADFRRPSLHKIFKVPGSPGLTDVLAADDDRQLPLHQLSSHLTLLPAGTPKSDPMAGLTSGRMRMMVEEAREKFTWVVIDTPPIGLLPDASLLAAMVDGTLLVVKAGATPHDLVKRAVDAIGPERLVGVVLNRAMTDAHRYGYGYSYYTHYHAPGGAS